MVSAAAALEPDRYVSDEQVEDLATVISLVCLYDRLVVVGPKHLLDFDNPFIDFLRQEVVDTREPSKADWKRSVARAERHAGKFLGVGRLHDADEIFNDIYSMSRRYGIDRGDLSPDGPQDLDIGKSLLVQVKTADDLRRFVADDQNRVVVAYVIRTFLYIGFSDRLGLPLAIDAARQPLLEHLADESQERLREAILTVMTDGRRSDRSLRGPVRRIASPFAAVVFNESETREQVLARLRRLRGEQLELRDRLRPLEDKLETATGGERDEVEARISAALEQLAQRYSVKSTQDLRVRRILGAFKPAAALAALKPVDAADFLARQLLDKDAVATLAELHELKRNLPATAEQDADIKRLFDL